MPVIAATVFLGIVLGSMYFGALWLTLRRLSHARRPGLLLVTSLLARLSLLLVGLYWILDDGHWGRLMAVLVGFVSIRMLLTRLMRPASPARPAHSTDESLL
ncbi:MAG: ATP synthase subunit I [Proteobacteria bacterium]|nr:MAG: ATP synthase subunit I [Pseudomonadota bacterium]